MTGVICNEDSELGLGAGVLTGAITLGLPTPSLCYPFTRKNWNFRPRNGDRKRNWPFRKPSPTLGCPKTFCSLFPS